MFAQNDTVILFCGQGTQSKVINFHILDHSIIKSINLNNININQVYSPKNNEFIIVEGNKFITYNNTSGDISTFFEASDTIIDVQYEEISGNYFIALPHEIIMLITNSSSFEQLAIKDSRIESIELIYK